MSNGLRKIYLYHSFFGSVLTELDCDAHTNIMGGNAAGKTTTLSLIPVFYGLEPNKVVSRAAEKKSFQGHYLPNQHSMIVFEYQREDAICCSVIYRNGESIAYRFITGSADETLFEESMLNALTEDMSAKDWLREVIAQNFPTSMQLTTCVDYKAVIQNDKSRTRARRKQGHGLMVAASKYSLCGTEHEMKHIDSLSSVLISKGKLLSKFKTMVVDSFLADQIEIGDAPYHKGDRDYIGSLEALIELEKHKNKFSEAIQSNVDLKDAWSALLGIKHSLEVDSVKIFDEHKSLAKKTSTVINEIEATSQDYYKNIGMLKTALNTIDSKNTSDEQQIEAIYSERARWDDDIRISEKIADYDNLSFFIEKMDQDISHYNNLLVMVNKEEAEHRATISAENARHQRNVNKTNENIASVNAELQDIIKTENNEVEKRKAEHHRIKDEYSTLRQEVFSTLNNETMRLTAENAKASSQTEEEEELVKTVDKTIEEFEIQFEISTNKLRVAKANENELVLKRNDLVEQSNQKNDLLVNKRKEREYVMSILLPKDNTLRAFLNENVTEWQSTLGKAIRPELLGLKGLDPQLVDNNKSLFGVVLNLDNIDIPEYAQKNEVLEQRKLSIERDIVNLEAEITAISNKVKLEIKAIKEANTLVCTLNRELENIIDGKKAAGLRRRALLDKIEANKSARIEIASAKLKEQLKIVDEHHVETKKVLDEREIEHRNDIIQYKAFMSSSQAECDEKIDKLKTQINELNTSHKARINEINTVFNELLEEKGVDPKKENEAKLRKENSIKAAENVKSFATLINQYNVWNQHQWKKLADMEKTLSENKLLSTAKSREIEAFNKLYDTKRKALNDQKTELERRTSIHDKLKKDVASALVKIDEEIDNAPDGHPVQIVDSSASTAELISLAFAKSSDARNKVSNIKTQVKKADSIINGIEADNKIYETWKEIKLDIVTREGFEDASEKHYLRCLDKLSDFLSETLPNIQQLTIEGTRLVGERYIRFFQILETLNRKISNVSKKLETSINTANKFPALDDIKVTLESKIQEFSHFSELKTFNTSWNDWGKNGRHSLPDKNYLNAFSDAIDALKSGGITNNIDSLVEINISLLENGRKVVVRCDEDLKSASSNGMSTLAVCVVFCGMTRFLCSDRSINIHWPFDELANIHESNIILLFEFMDENNITLFCAQPNLSVILMRYFPIKIQVEHNVGAKRYTSSGNKPKNRLIEMAGE